MPSTDFDLNNPSPDEGHEAIRVAVVQAIADLSDTSAGMNDSLDLLDTVFDLLLGALDTIDELSARIDALDSPVVAPGDSGYEPAGDGSPSDGT